MWSSSRGPATKVQARPDESPAAHDLHGFQRLSRVVRDGLELSFPLIGSLDHAVEFPTKSICEPFHQL